MSILFLILIIGFFILNNIIQRRSRETYLKRRQKKWDAVERQKREYKENLWQFDFERDYIYKNKKKAKQEWRRTKYDKNAKRKFKVIISPLLDDPQHIGINSKVINISGESSYIDLDTGWIKSLAIEKSANIVLIDQYGNVYERIGPDGKYPIRTDEDKSWETWFGRERGYDM